MKLTLTIDELKNLLSEKLGTSIDEVIITNPYILGVQLLGIITNAVEKFRYDSNEKISAVRSLREVTATVRPEGGIGLADAKYAVEHWHEFKRFIGSAGRLPKDGYTFNGFE